MTDSARLRGRGEPDAQPWELVLKYGDSGIVQIVADQAQVQIPALRAAPIHGSAPLRRKASPRD